jgi:hypothetical protein
MPRKSKMWYVSTDYRRHPAKDPRCYLHERVIEVAENPEWLRNGSTKIRSLTARAAAREYQRNILPFQRLISEENEDHSMYHGWWNRERGLNMSDYDRKVRLRQTRRSFKALRIVVLHETDQIVQDRLLARALEVPLVLEVKETGSCGSMFERHRAKHR